ncbi:MAG: radical SAM protein [Peptococcaceae bacterium]|nr:radical SAM protein [Peptococcaceae bacterium]
MRKNLTVEIKKGLKQVKPSMYNFIWPADDPAKVMIFNSLTTALAEVEKTHLDLLDLPRFDYDTLPDAARRFAEGLKQGGFVLDDAADELKILKFAYNSNKYNRMAIGFTVAPTLRCNFACTYCYEQAGENGDRRDGQNAFMPEHVREELLKFIAQAAKTVKAVYITWYGGEPLLGREIIFDLSQKIIAVTEENKIAYSAGMITNGYLLAEDPDLVQKLKDSRIKFFQITLDGPPETHNRRRMLKGGNGPTFDRILEGVKLLAANGMEVGLRINVDRSNMEEALKLLDLLEENNLQDISVHLGHVHADTAGCKSIESSCATMEEFTAFNQTFRETLRQRGFKTGQTPYYPGIAHACGANRVNAFVLDPDGDMYKCWSEIGDKPARIGNIVGFKQRGKDERMREIRWLTWEPFEYADCLACKVLPVCMGGCGYRAMFVNKDRPACGEWKYSLEHYVRARYHREKNLKAEANLPKMA